MAGELIGAAVGKPGIGGYLDNQRTLGDYPGLYATMILILIIGLVVDSVFGVVEKSIRRRRGLLESRELAGARLGWVAARNAASGPLEINGNAT